MDTRNAVLYFEDIEIGRVYTSPRRTITVGDIAGFAGLTGDFSERHMCDEPNPADPAPLYPGRIAHGLLGLSVQAGLASNVARTAAIAFLGLSWSFRAPIIPGDTVYVRFSAATKRLSKSRPGVGVVTWQRQILNQHDDVVQEGEQVLLVRCQPEKDA